MKIYVCEISMQFRLSEICLVSLRDMASCSSFIIMLLCSLPTAVQVILSPYRTENSSSTIWWTSNYSFRAVRCRHFLIMGDHQYKFYYPVCWTPLTLTKHLPLRRTFFRPSPPLVCPWHFTTYIWGESFTTYQQMGLYCFSRVCVLFNISVTEMITCLQ